MIRYRNRLAPTRGGITGSTTFRRERGKICHHDKMPSLRKFVHSPYAPVSFGFQNQPPLPRRLAPNAFAGVTPNL